MKVPVGVTFPARAVELDRGLTPKGAFTRDTLERAESCMTRMRSFLEELHGLIEDTFFSHHPDQEDRA